MNNTKKILAIVLSVLLLISVMPIAAFAATTEVGADLATAVAEAAAGDTLKLTQDVSVTSINIDKKLTIDLNGHNITTTAPSYTAAVFVIAPTGNLTIKSTGASALTTNDAAGTVSYTAGKVSTAKRVIENQGTFTLSSGILEGDDIVRAYAGSTTTISGGWCKGDDGAVFSKADATGATINVKGGAITSESNACVMTNGSTTCYGNTVNISGGTMYARMSQQGVDAGYMAMVVYHPSNNTLNISGGKMKAFNGAGVVVRGGDVNITGGTIIATGNTTGKCGDASAPLVASSALVVDTQCNYPASSSVDVDITSGRLTSDIATIATYDEGAATSADDAITVTGGTFSDDVSEYMPAEDVVYTIPDGSGDQVIIAADTVALYKNNSGVWVPVDSVMYALQCAVDNTTVYVLKDVENDLHDGKAYQPWLRGNRTVTLDLQGHDVTTNYGSESAGTINPSIALGSSTTSASSGGANLTITSTGAPATLNAKYGISFHDNTKTNNPSVLTIDDNVTVTSDCTYTIMYDKNAKNGTLVVDGTVENTNPDGVGVYVNGNAGANDSVTINGTVNGGEAGIYAAGNATYNINGTVTGDTGIYVAQGTVNVNDGAKVVGNGAKEDYQYMGSGFASTGDGIAVDSKYTNAPTVNVNEGATVESMAGEAVGEYKKTEESPAATVDVDEDATLIEHNYNVEYTSPSGAVSYKNFSSSFSSNGTYKLLDDVTVSLRISPTVFTSNVVIDMNGKNLTSSAPDEVFILGRNGSASAHKTWSVINTSSTPSVIEATEADCDGVVITGSFNDFTLGENVTLKTKDVAAWIGETKANNSITIDGDVETSDCYALYVHGTNAGPNTVTVNGSVKGDEVGIYAAGNADYIINGTVEGDTGVYIKSGTLTVNDGATVKGTGATSAYTYNGSGVNATGDAIVVDNCGYPGGTPEATINGGDILSTSGAAVASYVKQDDASQTGEFDRVGDIIPADSTAVFSSNVTPLAVDGYKTVYDEEAGGYVVEEINANNGSSLTLNDGVSLNVYLDADAYGLDADEAVVKVTYNHNADVSKEKAISTDVIPLTEATRFIKLGDPYSGDYKFSFAMAPAQFAEDVTIELYASEEAQTAAFSATTNVKAKCDQVINLAQTNDAYTSYATLCGALEDYCVASQVYFNYDAPAAPAYNNAAVTTMDASDMEVPTASVGISAAGFSFTVVSGLEVNVFYTGDLEVTDVSIVSTKGADSVTAATTVKGDKSCINIKGIASGNMDNLVTVTTTAGDVTLAATNIAKAIAASSNNINYVNLARALYLYSVQASSYFGC